MILAYCMMLGGAEDGGGRRVPESGVRGSAVLCFKRAGLECYFSDLGKHIVHSDLDANEDPLQFHSVVQKLFVQSAVVPFRFPALLADRGKLESFVERHAEQYARELKRLGGRQQMKVEVNAALVESRPTMSGTEFLRARYDVNKGLERFASCVMAEAEGLAAEWKKREKIQSLSLFALVDKENWPELRRRVLRVCEAEKIAARVTGPWPPSEFIDWYPEVE